jgi:uncharacterized protein HemY
MTSVPAHSVHHLLPLAASNVSFVVVFSIFVVALVVLIVITLRFVIRRDRQGRVAWRERQQNQATTAEGDGPAPPRQPPRP